MKRRDTYLKQLDVRVEQITLGDVDALNTQLMHQTQDACGDGSFPVVAKIVINCERRLQECMHNPLAMCWLTFCSAGAPD
jgi:hypothetical protein